MYETELENIEWIDPKKLILNPNNTNTHSDDQIKSLAKIIKYQGWRHPIVVREENGMVAAGEGRYLAALKLKLKKVPVSLQSFETDDQFNAFVTSDNAIAAWSTLDYSKINEQLMEMGPDFEVELLGIKDFQIDPNEFEAPEIKQTEKIAKECPHCGELL